MQPSLKLKLSSEQQDFVKVQVAEVITLLNSVVAANAEQIGYFLQAYYPKEKVRGVEIVAGSVELKDNHILLNITYTLEEFNACSAVDTEDRKQMPVSVAIDRVNGELNLVGEYWPEA